MSWIDLRGLIMLQMTARHRLFCAIDIFNNGRSCKVSVLMEQTSVVKCLQKAPPHSWQMNKEIVSVKIICYFSDVRRHLTTGKKIMRTKMHLKKWGKNWPRRFVNISCGTAQLNWKWAFELISKQPMNLFVKENWNKWLLLLFSFGDRANNSF